MELKRATKIRGQTLLAQNNCCDVETEDGREYRIVNFYVDNLEKVLDKFPIQIGILGDHHAVIHDDRISDSLYRDRFCEACCPEELLPLPQKLRHQRQETRDERHTVITPSGQRRTVLRVGE